MHTGLTYVYRRHCLVDVSNVYRRHCLVHVSNAINNIPEPCLTVCETMNVKQGSKYRQGRER